jgi:hypothetical protein
MPWRIPWATHSLEWLRYIGQILIDCGSFGCRRGLPSRGPINFTGFLEGTLEGGLRERPFILIPLTIYSFKDSAEFSSSRRSTDTPLKDPKDERVEAGEACTSLLGDSAPTSTNSRKDPNDSHNED